MTLLIAPTTMQELEREQISTGKTAHALIRTAGEACANAISAHFPRLRRVLICAGPGNNGADALVAAEFLVQKMVSVTIITWHRPLADSWLTDARAAGAEYIENWDAQAIQTLLPHVDVVIDGLFGIGLNRAPQGALADLITTLNGRHRRLPLVAIDIPSGCNAADGSIPGVCLRADLTLSTGPRKHGLYLLPTLAMTGTIVELDIGISIPPYDRRATLLLDEQTVSSLLPQRPADSYKGTYGSVCVWAGSVAYPGAAQLACLATARTGAGIVSLAGAQSSFERSWSTPEVTLTPFHDDPLEALVQSHFSTYLIGPGIGRSADAATLLVDFLSSPDVAGRPVVLDADALTLLARIPDWQQVIAAVPCVLTPHYGELRRLAGGQCADLPPIAMAQHYAKTWGQVIVMKGSVTVVASPDGRTALWAHPNPVLAIAGSGDVLAGIIAGLIAQHADLYAAACAGVAVHGLAGSHVGQTVGNVGALASDLTTALPHVLQSLYALR
jgi:NAD(P)H-hydrate epimerase